jgi:primosomal protein N' (replication factor Y)
MECWCRLLTFRTLQSQAGFGRCGAVSARASGLELVAIVRVALPVATNQLFDYWSPSGLEIQRGSVLRVRLGQRRLLGIAVDRVEASDVAPERVAPIDEVVTALPRLPEDLCALAQFVCEYYQQPIGQCFAQLLPPLGATSRIH